jgi:hypothetical protein
VWAFVYLALRRPLLLLIHPVRSDASTEIKLLTLRDDADVLRGQVNRLSFETVDRVLLAALSRALNRHIWNAFGVTSERLLAWHRRLVARRWTYPHRKPWWPKIDDSTTGLAVRLERENPRCGYRRIQGELLKLSIRLAANRTLRAEARRTSPRSLDAHRVGLIARWMAVLGAVLALSACGSSPPGLLTSADVPSYLGTSFNSTVSASEEGLLSPTRQCQRAGVAVFSVPGRGVPFGAVLKQVKAPEILSVNTACDSTADARAFFQTSVRLYGGDSVSGIGNEAELVMLGRDGGRAYFVGWRKNNYVGFVVAAGSPDDTRIAPALAELLARRAVARS